MCVCYCYVCLSQSIIDDEVTYRFSTEGIYDYNHSNDVMLVKVGVAIYVQMYVVYITEVEQWNFLTRTQMQLNLG